MMSDDNEESGVTTVEPPITHPLMSGQPLYNGHWLWHQLKLLVRPGAGGQSATPTCTRREGVMAHNHPLLVWDLEIYVSVHLLLFRTLFMSTMLMCVVICILILTLSLL